MKRSYNGDTDGTQPDRRAILKTGALGLTSIVGGTGLASAELNQKQPQGSAVYTAKASGGAAISNERRRAVRRQAARDFERKNGRAPAAIPASEQVTSSGEVVAYAYGFDANGVGRSYVGIAGEDMTEPQAESGRAEAQIHDQFDSHVADISSAIETSEQVTTMAGGMVSDTNNMEQVFSQKLEYLEDPYGTVGSTFYWFIDTLGSSEGDVHALHSPAGYEPGTSKYGSDYKNEWGRVFHRWNQSEMGNTDVDYGQWKPYGTQGGSSSTSYSLSVSAGWMTASVTAGISWSYSQPNVEVVDESSPTSEYNQWQLKLNSAWDDDTRENFIGFQPSSAASMNHYDSSSMGKRTISGNEVKAQFSNGDSSRNLWSKNEFYLQPA
ncbi:hypothetical protein ZOD2009_03015 [Haladaptatus paucihalophilus DX253]|uniref:Uncharacterized protein n=1 Tax=Haladaptatus paucihalophilus DX253 TaxID=797209 RepID=E7QNL0_HALPU|nr:hypothetical protein [Haladaptatus paucihalophilus]EFW94080.1 hypothetical protein ZOD2009_03015 [Haladaptatus paucihalophilus DX253]SHK62359.1 hypothetical protein SAMN05444342_1887 [Haladaptatus paucihalophilus DX253]